MRSNYLYPLTALVVLLSGCAVSPQGRVSWLNGSTVKDNAGVVVGVDLSRGAYLPVAAEPGTWHVIGDAPLVGDVAPIDDQNLAMLSNFQNLSWLDLTGTSVKGSGLEHLSDPLLLRKLNLTATSITDDDLLLVTRFEELTSLQLSGTSITDRGLHQLTPIKTLEVLELDNTAISDAAIETLKAFPNLRVVYLRDTRVTESGVERLQAAKPQIRVVTARPMGGII